MSLIFSSHPESALSAASRIPTNADCSWTLIRIPGDHDELPSLLTGRRSCLAHPMTGHTEEPKSLDRENRPATPILF